MPNMEPVPDLDPCEHGTVRFRPGYLVVAVVVFGLLALIETTDSA